jgi:hypothetical protein
VPFGLRPQKQRGNTIEVTLVDAASGRPFATSAMPVDQLPETFHELSTTMSVAGEDWQVERADPVDRAGYVEVGRLTLVLRKIGKIDPSKILFSLPTLEEALPPMRERDAAPAYAMHEDDWRQREFVSRQFAGEVESEFAEIHRIYDGQQGLGFKRCHVRSRIRAPLLESRLSLGDVSEALGGIEPIGLSVGGGRVIDGFAFPLPGGAAYARVAGGAVQVLGLHGDAEPGGLRGLANEHGLVLVDWIRASTS